MKSGIYYILNTISKRVYVGSSKEIERRLSVHKRGLRQNKHHNIHLQRSWNKYSSDAFIFGILEETSKEVLLIEEQKYLNVNTHGYNIAPANGGDCISNHPNNDKIREKISIGVRKRNEKLSSDERKLVYGRKGKLNGNYQGIGDRSKKQICPLCNITKIHENAKTCNECRDKSGGNNPFYGKNHSEKTKQILREKNSGDNSWIKGIDPQKLSYTKRYLLIYPGKKQKYVYGLKIIAKEFKTSIANTSLVIKRIKDGKLPKRGVFAGMLIFTVII